ncbi:hypothetical protein Q4488_13805 [Amphritea sp. 1_MG-2023]|uniref:hypothetical protein n=1 Tax=Amphritea sp. 1_MG-2023 TaxID=3062670 RepID=UPI0026E25F66|nr:hypothetical protein [Amphritea sp. 1_MG-2023]MDO6564460.1 hypothetical protein [Amphritea sp. 1_MG-2023]
MNSIESLHQILSFGTYREQAFVCLATEGRALDCQSITATKQHLMTVLEKYLCGDISADDLEEWALFIECRDDIQCEPIEDYVYALANPSLMGEIGQSTIVSMLQLLKLV